MEMVKEGVMIEFSSASVTYPFLSVSGVCMRDIQAVLVHKYGTRRGARRGST